MKLPTTGLGDIKLTVERLDSTQFNAGLLQMSPRNPNYWAGVEKYAKDAGDASFDTQIKQVKDACSNVSNKDALIPAERLVAYDQRITLEQSSKIANSGIDREAFGFDMAMDPRADTIVRYSMEIAGKIAKYCCGTDPTTVGANLHPHKTKRGWYSVGFELCWFDQMSLQYGGMFNYMLTLQHLCMQVLNQARCEVAFSGDEQQNLRGLKQLQVKRVTLPTPIDQMAAIDVYKLWVMLANHAEISQGERGISKDHLLYPRGLNAVFSQLLELPGCCSKLGEKLAGVSDVPLMGVMSDYMNDIGEGGTPAAFFWNRSEEYFRRDMAFMPMWLSPQYECQKLKFQAVMRLGELDCLNADAGLLVSNFMTGRC
jgi:hypothetical protein